MADFDPDTFINKAKDFSPDKFISKNEPPDPGFWPAVGRAARGLATGVESTVDYMGSSLPGFLGPHDPELAKKTREDIPEPKGDLEGFTHGVGEILPTLAVPGLGADAATVRAIRYATGLRGAELTRFVSPKGFKSALERISGSVAEGGARGTIGGAMMPGDDVTENAEIGGLTGAGIRGAGAVGHSAISALPPALKNTVSAVAAFATANKLGLPWWVALTHPGGWHTDSIFKKVYDSNLADLAAKYFRGLTRAPSGAVLGAGGVKLKDATQ